jgi:hypothetical protein
MSDPLHFAEVLAVADNDHGWRFAVGRMGDRWLGFATGSQYAADARDAFRSVGLPVEAGYLHVFAEVSTGYQLGVSDRDRAVLLTGALAQDPEGCFGGVDRWHVPEALRGKPDDYRCATCGQVGCDGVRCADLLDPFDDEDEYP